MQPCTKKILEQGPKKIDNKLDEFERHAPEGISSFNKSFTPGTLFFHHVVLSNQSLILSRRREQIP